MADPIVTTISTEGQVILPRRIRVLRQRDAGTRLMVEDTDDQVMLKAAPVFVPTRYDEVRGMLHLPGQPAKTIEEMDANLGSS